MEKKIKVTESCCACEANMEESIDKLVRESQEGSTKAEHDRKKEEVEAAFGQDEK